MKYISAQDFKNYIFHSGYSVDIQNYPTYHKLIKLMPSNIYKYNPPLRYRRKYNSQPSIDF